LSEDVEPQLRDPEHLLILNRIERLESRVSRIEGKLDVIEQLITNIKPQDNKNRSEMWKYFIIMLVLILSFISAWLGLGWIPPISP